MNNHYFEKLSRQGFSTITSALQQFVQHTYTLQFTTFFWCQSGEAIITIDGYRFRFTHGCIVICPAGSNITVHDITSDFSARLLGLSKHIWMAARSSFTPEAMQDITRMPYIGKCNDIEKEFVSNIFRQIDIIETLVANDPASIEFCRQNIILSVNDKYASI